MTTTNSHINNVERANIIAGQLAGGWGKLCGMIGACHARVTDTGLSFRFKARARDGINFIEIDLMPSDTYRIRYSRVTVAGCVTKAVEDDVYAEDLRRFVEDRTGLALTMPKVFAA